MLGTTTAANSSIKIGYVNVSLSKFERHPQNENPYFKSACAAPLGAEQNGILKRDQNSKQNVFRFLSKFKRNLKNEMSHFKSACVVSPGESTEVNSLVQTLIF